VTGEPVLRMRPIRACRGERKHVRMMNADGNDLCITDSGVDQESLIMSGGSILTSAMASWVLSVFSGLAARLGEPALATEAKAQADNLRELVREAWNGKWHDRTYAPGGKVIGGRKGDEDDEMWLEVRPWAILCGAADTIQAQSLLKTIATGPGADSPLGTQWRWPLSIDKGYNGIWYYVNMTLIWAAARVLPDWARDQWRRMTLTTAYPYIWEETLSGPVGSYISAPWALRRAA
jgi:hypothetical protein